MAPGTLTGLPEVDLERWLVEMRKACALTGDAALAAVDLVIWSLEAWREGRREGNPVAREAQDASPALPEATVGLWTIAEELSRLRETVARVRRQQAAGTVDAWEAATLRRRAEAIGHTAGPAARAQMAADIAAAQEEARALAAEIERSAP